MTALCSMVATDGRARTGEVGGFRGRARVETREVAAGRLSRDRTRRPPGWRGWQGVRRVPLAGSSRWLGLTWGGAGCWRVPGGSRCSRGARSASTVLALPGGCPWGPRNPRGRGRARESPLSSDTAEMFDCPAARADLSNAAHRGPDHCLCGRASAIDGRDRDRCRPLRASPTIDVADLSWIDHCQGPWELCVPLGIPLEVRDQAP